MPDEKKFWTDAPAEVLGYYAKAHKLPTNESWVVDGRSRMLGPGESHTFMWNPSAITLRSIGSRIVPPTPTPTPENTIRSKDD